MELPQTIYIGIGAVAAAFIAGFFGFINLITSKDQKTSEFRQEWIDSLRNELSEFCSSVSTFCSFLMHFEEIHNDNFESKNKARLNFFENNTKLINSITESYNKIRLRLNPEDDKELLDRLKKVYDLAASQALPTSVQQVSEVTNLLIKESQILLKKEWKRVKKGETSFWLSKWVALSLLVLTVLSTVAYVQGFLEFKS
jgi:flagellin-specific chaperone FliS